MKLLFLAALCVVATASSGSDEPPACVAQCAQDCEDAQGAPNMDEESGEENPTLCTCLQDCDVSECEDNDLAIIKTFINPTCGICEDIGLPSMFSEIAPMTCASETACLGPGLQYCAVTCGTCEVEEEDDDDDAASSSVRAVPVVVAVIASALVFA